MLATFGLRSVAVHTGVATYHSNTRSRAAPCSRGRPFSEVVDLVLRTDDTNEPYRRALLAWAASAARSTDQANERLAGRFADVDRFEEARRLRETFGGLPEAAGVLRRLAEAIETLDKTADEPTPTDTNRRPPR